MTTIKAITVGERGCDGVRAEERVSGAYVLYFYISVLSVLSLTIVLNPTFRFFFSSECTLYFKYFKFKRKNK